MKLNIITIAVIGSIVLLFACRKDTYNTKPTLKIQTGYPAVVQGQDVYINVEMTDKQGDIRGGVFTCKAVRLNEKPLEVGIPDYAVLTDTISAENGYDLDRDFTKATFEKRFPYQGYLKKSNVDNDTIQIYFSFLDRGRNQSDTVFTTTMVILKQ